MTKFYIDDQLKALVTVNSDNVKAVLYKFIDPQILKDTKYTLYAYVEIVNDILYVKFGEAKDQSIYNRYKTVTGSRATDHMIMIWESDKGDKEIHTKLRLRSKNLRGYLPADKTILNTTEAYEIQSLQGLYNLISDISEYASASAIPFRTYRKDYQDIVTLCNYLVESYKEGKYKYILDLCTRYGKTGTFCLLFSSLNSLGIRLHILASYVGTVKTSYSNEIVELENNSNCMFVDPDLYDDTDALVKSMKLWLKDPSHYICYYVALTGDKDTCYNRRVLPLNKFNKVYKSITIEEADYGSTCDKQIDKIKSLAINNRTGEFKNNYKCIFTTTGTKAEKCNRIIEPDINIKRDYILDVLNVRPNAVGINWYCLNNSEMVKVFDYEAAEMENFSDMFIVENGQLRGDIWFRDVIDFLYNKRLPTNTRDNRKYRNNNLIDLEAASIIFTARNKDGQQALKTLIETLLPGYLVKVINSDETSNTEAEAEARQAIKDHGTRVIFIAGDMANRSFSVPEIKNVILMCNTGLPDQKIARGLTPWKGHYDKRCNIIDFRLLYEQSNFSTYLANIAIDTLEKNTTYTSLQQILETIRSSDKLGFYEYFTSDVNPIKQLSDDEIKLQLNNKNYLHIKAARILEKDILTIDIPKEGYELSAEFKFNLLAQSDNVKGDADKKAPINRNVKYKRVNKEATAEDQRRTYLAYLLENKDEFNSGKYESNILENEFLHNMSKERVAAIENLLGIDMKVMTQIAKLLIKNDIKIYN